VDVPWRATSGELGRFERVRLAASGRARVWRPRDARFTARAVRRGTGQRGRRTDTTARGPEREVVGWLHVQSRPI